jgi:hypothetical protein
MKSLSVPQRLDKVGLDDLTAQLADGAGPLSMASTTVTTNPLAIPQALLAVISWSHMNREVVTKFPFDNEEEAAKKLQRNTVLLTAILMADKVTGPGGADVTVDAYRAALAALKQADNIPASGSGESVGSERAVIAADHIPPLRAPRGLYLHTSDGPTIAHEAVEVYAKKLIEIPRPVWPLGWRVMGMSPVGLRHDDRFAYDAYDLGKALFELVQNTHDHARSNALDARYTHSVRGVHVRALTQKRARLMESAAQQRDLSEYFAAFPSGSKPSTMSDQLRFVAVTVFDSGPGLAARTLWKSGLRGNARPEQELRAMLDALRKHDSGDDDGLRGLGLTNVQKYLTKVGGYGMIRSGRFRLTRDFRAHPYTKGEDNSNKWWGQLAKPSVLTKVRGTAFTMVVPTRGGQHG